MRRREMPYWQSQEKYSLFKELSNVKQTTCVGPQEFYGGTDDKTTSWKDEIRRSSGRKTWRVSFPSGVRLDSHEAKLLSGSEESNIYIGTDNDIRD